jgi:hypothetical protein
MLSRLLIGKVHSTDLELTELPAFHQHVSWLNILPPQIKTDWYVIENLQYSERKQSQHRIKRRMDNTALTSPPGPGWVSSLIALFHINRSKVFSFTRIRMPSIILGLDVIHLLHCWVRVRSPSAFLRQLTQTVNSCHQKRLLARVCSLAQVILLVWISMAFSPQANYTNQATAACWRS